MNSYGLQPQPTGERNLAATNEVYYQEATRKLHFDMLLPDTDELHPGVVLVHGGGWLHGDKTKFRRLAERLTASGFAVMSVEYRLGHEAKFPAGVRDCFAALKFLRANARRYQVDPKRIALVGGSAGGHIVGLMGTGHDVEQLQPSGDITGLKQQTDPISARADAVVVMAGPMQIASGSVAERSQSGMESNAIHWLGKTIDEAPELYHLADAFEKISADDPPMLFIRGTLDQPHADDLSLGKLKSVGVAASQKLHEGAKHGHWNRDETMGEVVSDIVDFLNQQL